MADFLTQIADWLAGAEFAVKPLMTPVFAPGPSTGDEIPQKALLEGEPSINIEPPVSEKEIKRPKQEHLDAKEHIEEYKPKSNTEQYIAKQEDFEPLTKLRENLPNQPENRIKEPLSADNKEEFKSKESAFIEPAEQKPNKVKHEKVIEQAKQKVEPITIKEPLPAPKKEGFKAGEAAFIEPAEQKLNEIEKETVMEPAESKVEPPAPKKVSKKVEFIAAEPAVIEPAEQKDSRLSAITMRKAPKYKETRKPAKPVIEPTEIEPRPKAMQQAIQIAKQPDHMKKNNEILKQAVKSKEPRNTFSEQKSLEPDAQIIRPEKAAELAPKKIDKKLEIEQDMQPVILNMRTPARYQEPRQRKQNKEKKQQTIKVNIGSLTIKDSFKQKHKTKPVYTSSQYNRPQFKPAVTLEQYLRNRG